MRQWETVSGGMTRFTDADGKRWVRFALSGTTADGRRMGVTYEVESDRLDRAPGLYRRILGDMVEMLEAKYGVLR